MSQKTETIIDKASAAKNYDHLMKILKPNAFKAIDLDGQFANLEELKQLLNLKDAQIFPHPCKVKLVDQLNVLVRSEELSREVRSEMAKISAEFVPF